MDLVVPKGGGPHPVVLLLHGGAWRSGAHEGFDAPKRRLAARGYAVASAGYRLAPEHPFPAAVADARCAVRWLRSHAREHDLDPDRIATLGVSAGGHLAALLATASEDDSLDDGCPIADASPRVQAAVAYYAPYDLRDLPEEVGRMVSQFLGAPPLEVPDRAERGSPIAHVEGSDPPMLLVHGTRDGTVPIEQARRMEHKLAASEVPVTLVPIEGARHGFPVLDSRREHRPATCSTLAFLNATIPP
ncbi:MAG: alpha/beta hydrolase fold domain-containing protein [Myxococcota bacterium]